jgi:glycosyltransferase involved in cell wall biosynthesis
MFVPIGRNIRLKRLYHRFWGRNLLAGANAIIATAEQERDELIAGGIDSAKIRLRRNGVEVPAALPVRGSFRARLNIPGLDKLVLFLGRLSQKKSPDLLLRAFTRLQQTLDTRGAQLHLAFVGPDEAGMEERLRSEARSKGISARVHFCGPLGGEAKWQAYRDADVFVLPSQNENFGNTAAESVAAGTPVIVTDQCGVAPLLKDVAGLVIDEQLHQKFRDGCALAASAMSWEEPLYEMEMIYSALASVRRT